MCHRPNGESVSRILRLLAAAFVTLGLALAGIGAPPAHAAAKVLFAFGDSVAAGEGSGPASGYDHNKGSFNEVLAADLGYQVHNFAQTAAESTDLLTQLQRAVATGKHPTLITVMMGANDISYAECLLAVVGVGTADPCTESALSVSLPALAHNLGTALGAIRATYPTAQVVLVGYYNPMPKPAKTLEKICPVMKTLYQASLLGAPSAFAAQAVSPNLAAVRAFQAQIHSNAQQVVGLLNQTIAGVAQAVGATFVTQNFTNHDFCADYAKKAPAWVLAPKVSAQGTLVVADGLALSLPGMVSLTALAQPRHSCVAGVLCPDGQSAHIVIRDISGPLLDYRLEVGTNDFPHLTVRGNHALADRIEAALGLAH